MNNIWYNKGMKDLKEAYKTIEARGFHPLTPKSAAL